VDTDRDLTSPQQVEGVGVPAFSTEQAARCEDGVARTSGDEFDRLFVHARHEGVHFHEVPHGLTHDAPGRDGTATRAWSCAAMAATSSVMSIPTGHQTMHRPHPTQPVESN